MLSEMEIRERAQYCYRVFLQLSWLYSNDSVEPPRYFERLADSSLGLGDDRFITMSIEEALAENRPDGGLLCLISLYEGFAHAFCEVLEQDPEEIRKGISREELRKLAAEMGVDARI